jgi:DNA-binding NarL/FixJ family response regulator
VAVKRGGRRRVGPAAEHDDERLLRWAHTGHGSTSGISGPHAIGLTLSRELLDFRDDVGFAQKSARRSAGSSVVSAGGMERALTTELWHRLETGSWSVVDQVDLDHHRYVLAGENVRTVWDTRALTERERRVVEIASRGLSNKVIAYELGVATSTVSTHLSHAATKLGVASRASVIQVYAALTARRDTEVSYVGWDGKRFAVIAMRLGASLPAALSPAERQVVRLAILGRSNLAIARARDVSPRTIENQLSAAMKKLGASSRADLAAMLFRA